MANLAQIPSKISKKWEEFTFQPKTSFKIICNSIGGVASSAVFGWLQERCDINDIGFPPGKSLYKHTIYPPDYPFIEKGVFIYGEPTISTVSVLRRGMIDTHLLNKGLPPLKINSEEYYLSHSDIFRTSEHIYNWLHPNVNYPIFTAKFDYLHDHLEEFFDFLEIDRALISTFPAKRIRKSKIEDLPVNTRDQLKKLLRDACFIYNESPEFKIIEPNTI